MTLSVSIAPHPPTRPTPLRATRGERVVCALLAAACLGLLATAAWLRPDSRGVGTHEALGLSPCGWIAGFGIPCPTCGMTTSFALAVRGSLWASFRVQPMGCALAVVTAATAVIGAFVAATGSRIGHVLGARITPRVLVAGAALALLAWGYKVAAMRGATSFGRCDLP
jgi:hypothetical protein